MGYVDREPAAAGVCVGFFTPISIAGLAVLGEPLENPWRVKVRLNRRVYSQLGYTLWMIKAVEKISPEPCE